MAARDGRELAGSPGRRLIFAGLPTSSARLPPRDRRYRERSSGMAHAGHRVGFIAGSSYQGGLGQGKATFVFSDGETYEGEWLDNMYEGQGKVRYTNGNTYAGGWKANLQHGQGKQVWISGSTYEGEWKEGYQHGHGVYTLAGTTTGFNVYDGQWERGRKEGRGKLTISKKNAILEEYDGEWKADRRHGKGMCSYGGPVRNDKVRKLWDGRGELEMGTYSEGYRVGEGVRWSADRLTQWKLMDGRAVKEIELSEAEAFAEALGFPAPPQPEPEETGNAQLNNTKGFD